MLTGLENALVIDVGGTSSDIGAVRSGFPRETSPPVEIGGVRTNSAMPDILAIALGGGTIVGGSAGRSRPRSRTASAAISGERALVFGGDHADHDGRLRRRRPPASRPVTHLDRDEPPGGALRRGDELIADLVDRMRLSRDPLPLVAVGGGSHLVPDAVPGVSQVVRPPDGDVANAYGAGIASVAGEVDRVFPVTADGRSAVVEEATEAAIERAVAAGAEPGRIAVVLREETSLAYTATPMVRVRVKAAGPLQTTEAR